ncbi:YsnF/AvaK domain-containing protein [Planococcus salinus]|uniref:YsnF/AvaK domain-containing protein n=1 Tax=Planococcus salinus TaxID=1848460 RepID=A0A3M8P7F6_9BACL|nr:YsnF/AvaK domain-containing protein [Planococcus salinus]RNF39577.1 YsnF/AvaK domain-containing protein [Planococcus salinus]
MGRKENTFIGVFDTQAEVLSKVTELKAQGVNERDMYVVGQNHDSFSMVENQTDVHTDAAREQQDRSFKGNFISALSDESSSRAAFSSMGLDPDESEEYFRQVRNGKLVLYADSDYGDSYDRYSHSAGTGQTAGTDATLGTEPNTRNAAATNDEEHLRLHEERLNVDKERVQTGEVNVGKHVVKEEKTIDVPVEREEVYVERRPVNEEATDTEGFDENKTIHIPVSEERVNVSKNDVVSEEIVVGKEKVKETEHVNEKVRREVADIDKDGDHLTDKDDKTRF